MHSKVFQLAFIAIASFLSSPASAQEFMQDSIYYRIIDGKAGVCYVNKYNTVIPATVTHSGRTYPVSGFTMPESEWTHWRGIGNNVRMLTIPVTCDTIYSSKDGDIGNFLFSGGKNLSGITVEAPTSGKRHFLPCTAAVHGETLHALWSISLPKAQVHWQQGHHLHIQCAAC